jgi:hypothetical protein
MPTRVSEGVVMKQTYHEDVIPRLFAKYDPYTLGERSITIRQFLGPRLGLSVLWRDAAGQANAARLAVRRVTAAVQTEVSKSGYTKSHC